MDATPCPTSHETCCSCGVTHDAHDELAAALGRRCPLKKLSPSPEGSCGAPPCAAAGRGGGHCSVKYKMHWSARSLLFVQLGVYLGGGGGDKGEQGWVGSPHQVPSQPQQKGSTWVPAGCQTQGHQTMPKPPLLWQKYFIIYIRLQPHSTGQGPEFAILHINTK